MLTVIERIPGNSQRRAKVLCRCDCGNTSTPNADNLSRGGSQSCGCQKRAAGAKNAKTRIKPGKGYGKIVPGAQFGRLTIIRRIYRLGEKHSRVACHCVCGAQVLVWIDSLVSGGTKSCGCLAKEVVIRRNVENSRHSGFSKKYPRTYLRWNSMISRCYNSKQKTFPAYGGRGVFVCGGLRESPWNLKRLIGLCKRPRTSLDRFPINNGNYTCGYCEDCKRNGWEQNIRWATRKDQSLNRGDFNVYLTAFGRTLTKSQWMELSGLSWSCLTGRINRGWDIERALSTPDGFGNYYDPCVDNV